MAVVAPSVADILHQASVSHQPSSKPLHVRAVSQKEIMDPIYATVQRKQKVRNTPEDTQQNSLEAFYGGKTISNSAAFIIQRAFRAYRLRKKFSKLLSVALTEESSNDTEEINVDTGLPMKADSPAAPDNLDLLILQAAGLETFTSIVHKVAPSQRHIKARRQGAGGQQPHLRRSTSLRICDKRASKKANLVCKDDTYVQGGIPGHEEGPSPPPEPCPELRGHYDKPKIPQRTVSFLAHQKLPQKVSQQQQRPLPQIPPQHVSYNSDVGLYDYVHLHQKPSAPLHTRCYSSPAPLSPQISNQKRPQQDHMVIEIPTLDTMDLPPPPYISPPIYSTKSDVNGSDSPSSPSMPSPPLPPPPKEFDEVSPKTEAKPQNNGQTRQPCDSSSSASSVDSGFGRSSCVESPPPNWNLASPNLLVSPETYGIIQDVVFEPRPQTTPCQHQPIYSQGNQRPPQRNHSILRKKTVRINPEPVQPVDEVARRRQYRVGLNLFNQYPEIGIEYLCKKDFIDYSPASVGQFLRGRKGLSKKMIGIYLCQLQRQFNLQALHCFIHDMDFTGLHLDIALRHLYQEVTPPASEAQKIEKMVEVFSRRYIACNQMFASGFRYDKMN